MKYKIRPSFFLFIERGRPVDVEVTEEGKDTFKCEYVAPVEGAYKVDVKFDGSPVPGSPFPVEVAKPGDAGKCKAQGDGLETAIIDQLAEFDVDCKSAGKIKLAEKYMGSFPRVFPCKLALRF